MATPGSTTVHTRAGVAVSVNISILALHSFGSRLVSKANIVDEKNEKKMNGKAGRMREMRGGRWEEDERRTEIILIRAQRN